MDIGVRTLNIVAEPSPSITANVPEATAEVEAILTSATLQEYEGALQKYQNLVKSSRRNEGAMIPRRNFNPQRIPRTTRRCAIIVPYQNNPELGTDRTEFLAAFHDHHTPISKLIETEAYRK
jgi:hypothetical protein